MRKETRGKRRARRPSLLAIQMELACNSCSFKFKEGKRILEERVSDAQQREEQEKSRNKMRKKDLKLA
jgi:hypothetical protein